MVLQAQTIISYLDSFCIGEGSTSNEDDDDCSSLDQNPITAFVAEIRQGQLTLPCTVEAPSLSLHMEVHKAVRVYSLLPTVELHGS